MAEPYQLTEDEYRWPTPPIEPEAEPLGEPELTKMRATVARALDPWADGPYFIVASDAASLPPTPSPSPKGGTE